MNKKTPPLRETKTTLIQLVRELTGDSVMASIKIYREKMKAILEVVQIS